jgi:pimeloyl-ACP methyl ester carboxylesterase
MFPRGCFQDEQDGRKGGIVVKKILRAKERRPFRSGVAKWGLSALACLTLLGCCASPPIPDSLDSPPLLLCPISKTDVSDGRGRFREIYSAIREDHGRQLPDDRPCEEAVIRLAEEPVATGRPVHLGPSRLALRIVVVPGIFGECVMEMFSPFSDALPHLEKYGYRTGLIPVSGRSSSAHNAAQIRDALVSLDLTSGEKLVLVGHSKGTLDILEALVAFPEIQERVTAVVGVAGPVGGSPLADEVADLYMKLLRKIPLPTCPPGDGGGVESLRRSTRLQWLSQHKLPKSVRYFSLTGFSDAEGISAILRPGYDKLAQIDPRNDSQVIFYDAIIPGSTLLGFVNADHWAIAYPFSRNQPALATLITRNAFPREVLLEAVVRFVEEALIDNE